MEYISHMGYPVKEEVIGQRVIRETLKFVPARLTVVRTIAKVYGCPQCKQGEDANIVGAEVPDALIPHSYVSESVAAHAMYQKFVNAVPLGRWIKICSDEYFAPIYEYFHRLLLGRQFAMTDGYQGYNNLPDIIRETCWAHIRRYFCDAIPSGKKEDLSEPAVQGVHYCDKLFAIERYCREHRYTHEQRHEYRNRKAPQILASFWSWLDKQQIAFTWLLI